MDFSYGQGTYSEGDKKIEGQIVLGDHKLFLRTNDGDLAQSYIPLEKIERICKKGASIEVHVRPSLYFQYIAVMAGERKHISNLTKDIVKRRGLKKQFLKSEWIETES